MAIPRPIAQKLRHQPVPKGLGLGMGPGSAREGEAAPFRLTPKSLFSMLKEAASEWSHDKASRLAAALSYYTLFSIAPLLIIAIALAGLVFGREAASNQIFLQVRGFVGDAGAQAIQGMVASAGRPGAGIIATAIGVATLLVGAAGAIGQLQDALNTIWEVEPKPGQGIKGFLRNRVLTFSMVLVIAFMLLVSLVLSAGLAGAGHYLDRLLPFPVGALQAINFLLSFLVISVLFAMIYKFLPDVEIGWKDVWIGGAVTALLFSIGKLLIGLYLGRGSVTSAFGAAGSLVVILIWIYYSSQILFFGAEFTQVYASRSGSRLKPAPNAIPVTDAQRANHQAEFLQQLRLAEGLLQEGRLGIQNPVLDDGVFRVSGHEQDRHMRIFGADQSRQLPPIHARHDHIREERIRPASRGQHVQPFFGILRFQHGIARRGKGMHDEFPHALLVLDHQYGSGTRKGRRLALGSQDRGSGIGFDQGQVYPDGGAFPQLRCHQDAALALLDDAVDAG
jgi:membrane protein